MRIEFPKKSFIINIHTMHAEYLEAQAAKEDRSVDNIVMSALVWYQMVQELPGARDAVLACRPPMPPKMKAAPMPTMQSLDAAINRLEKE